MHRFNGQISKDTFEFEISVCLLKNVAFKTVEILLFLLNLAIWPKPNPDNHQGQLSLLKSRPILDQGRLKMILNLYFLLFRQF